MLFLLKATAEADDSDLQFELADRKYFFQEKIFITMVRVDMKSSQVV